MPSPKAAHPSAQQLERDLLESRQIFKVVFERSPAGITVTNQHERITAWNPMVEKMLGMDRKDLFNKPVQDLYSPDEWKRMRDLQIRKHGMLADIATKVIRKDGTMLDVNTSIAVLKDNDGHVMGAIGIMHDMSRQKMVEEQLMQAKLAAEQANVAKSVFLANMSHEVRTPMNAVIGMLDLTLDTALNDEQKDNLEVAKDAADNLLSLINDILDLSRAEAGKIVVEEIEINAPDIVKNVHTSSFELRRISSNAVRSCRPTYAGNIVAMMSVGASLPVIPTGWTFRDRSKPLRSACFSAMGGALSPRRSRRRQANSRPACGRARSGEEMRG